MTTHLGAPVPRLSPLELQRQADRNLRAARTFMKLGDSDSAFRALRAALHYRSRLIPDAARSARYAALARPVRVRAR